MEDALFHRIAYNYSLTNWDGLRDHLRDVLLENIFKLVASAAASSEICKAVSGVSSYICIFLIINIRSSLTRVYGFQLLVLLS